MSEQDSRERFVVNVSVVIPQSLADRMDATERCQHDGRSSFIREAIRKMLKCDDYTTPNSPPCSELPCEQGSR